MFRQKILINCQCDSDTFINPVNPDSDKKEYSDKKKIINCQCDSGTFINPENPDSDKKRMFRQKKAVPILSELPLNIFLIYFILEGISNR